MTKANQSPTPSIISLDDDLAMHAVYDQLAQRLNRDHLSFDTIEDTLSYFQNTQEAPQVLILDRLLPDGDGLDFAVFAREKIVPLSQTHFILISGVKTDIHDQRLISAHIEHLFEKPFKINDLNAVTSDILAQEISTNNTMDQAYINIAFADDLLRLSIELLHASQSSNADPKRILHSIHGIAGMLEKETLRNNVARLMALTNAPTQTEHLPKILHIVQQCEEAAHQLTESSQAQPIKVAL